MGDDFTPEDAARLARRKAAQEAGIDLERDMCAHDYVNGIGCKECELWSDLFILAWIIAWIVVVILIIVVILQD